MSKKVRAKWPYVLFRIPLSKPGERIGIVQVHEMGYFVSQADKKEWTNTQVDEFISIKNELNGIPAHVVVAAVYASMDGWDTPDGQLAIDWIKKHKRELW